MRNNINDLYGVKAPVTVKTPYEKSDSNSTISIEGFLKLMIAELQNQDFTNPVDNSQYMTQMAQFATMQQMQTLAYYSKTNYVMGLVGKEVTVGKLSIGGKVESTTGLVEKITLSGEDYEVYVGGKAYAVSQIMSVSQSSVASKNALESVSNSTPYLLKRRAESAEIAWNPPETTDNLQYYYSVYYSEDPEFDSIPQVKQGTLVASLQGGEQSPSVSLTDLEPDTTYYVNVIINDKLGNEAVYQKLIFTTKDE